MLKILDNPRKHYRAISRALRDRGVKIYHCEDCGYIFLGGASKPPRRCANRECRAPAQGWKRPAASSEQAAQ